MRVLVTGGRDFTDTDYFYAVMNGIDNITEIIHGGAKGADSLADTFAREMDIPVSRYEADWANEGKSAGPRRNIRMLEKGKPDLVVAFPGGKGTAHMVKIATEAGIEVRQSTEHL